MIREIAIRVIAGVLVVLILYCVGMWLGVPLVGAMALKMASKAGK